LLACIICGLVINVTSENDLSNPALSQPSWTQGQCIWSQSATKLWSSYQNQDQKYRRCVPCGFFLLRICSVFPALPKTRHSNHARSKERFWWLNTDRFTYGWTNDGNDSYRNRFSYHSDHSADCLARSGSQVIRNLSAGLLKSSSPPLFSGRMAGHKVRAKALRQAQGVPEGYWGVTRSLDEVFWENNLHIVLTHTIATCPKT
jgi:hypothetical protein